MLNTESVSDLICFLLCRYLEANLRFHACKFCGKLFGVTKNYKQEYVILLLAVNFISSKMSDTSLI